MKKVYAVSAGVYSDYRIIAIFSSRERAEAFVRAVPHDDYNDIEEYELNPPTSDLIARGYAQWTVMMLKTGEVESATRRAVPSEFNATARLWRRTEAPAYKGKGIPDVLWAEVWAKTEKQAVKIANEMRVRMIANDEWNS